MLLESVAGISVHYCPFLSLPGELRNHIYDYCVEARPITPFPAIHQYAPSVPQFRDLRHASKKLYIEFTPLYLKRTIVSLDHSDVERYLSVFYPNHQDLSVGNRLVKGLNPIIHGHIRIHIRQSDVLDLTPFAGLLARAPNVHLEFVCKAATQAVLRNISEFARSITDPSRSINLENIVERVLFRCSLRSQVVIKLQQHVLLDELFNDYPNLNPRDWLIRQGFLATEHLELVMESSEGVLRDPPNRATWLPTLADHETKTH